MVCMFIEELKCVFVQVHFRRLFMIWLLLCSQAWIFVMISGQMWNNIRGPPFAHKDPHTGATVSSFTCVVEF